MMSFTAIIHEQNVLENNCPLTIEELKLAYFLKIEMQNCQC